MSDRVDTIISTSPSSPPSSGPIAARYFIVGQTGQGPIAPTVVRSLREYTAIFGTRTGGVAMYDAAELALRGGVSEVVVCRAYGPAPVKSTVSLDTGKIVVTAKDPGAFANTWTAAWNHTTNTLTIVAGDVTETYTGATATELVAAASASQRVTVTSSGTLPSTTVTATSLASGTDDYANVSWSAVLAAIDPAHGPGAIATPGVAHTVTGQALLTHAAQSHRLALLTVAPGTALAGATSAAATAQAYSDSTHGALVWPSVRVPAGGSLTKVVDPTAYAAAVRARALIAGAGESALAERYARLVTDVEPEFAVSSSDWATANTARVSVVRTVAGVTRMYSWQTLDSDPASLLPAQYRDMQNAMSYLGEQILESNVGLRGRSDVYSAVAGHLAGMVSGFANYLQPSDSHPGYIISVGGGNNPADHRIVATISVLFAESIEFADLVIAVGDANAAI